VSLPGKYMKYPPEFKANAIELASKSRHSFVHLAAELEVSAETLRRWVREDESTLAPSTPQVVLPVVAVSSEMRILRKENAELRRINGVLKSAISVLAAESHPMMGSSGTG
jgi:transposase